MKAVWYLIFVGLAISVGVESCCKVKRSDVRLDLRSAGCDYDPNAEKVLKQEQSKAARVMLEISHTMATDALGAAVGTLQSFGLGLVAGPVLGKMFELLWPSPGSNDAQALVDLAFERMKKYVDLKIGTAQKNALKAPILGFQDRLYEYGLLKYDNEAQRKAKDDNLHRIHEDMQTRGPAYYPENDDALAYSEQMPFFIQFVTMHLGVIQDLMDLTGKEMYTEQFKRFAKRYRDHAYKAVKKIKDDRLKQVHSIPRGGLWNRKECDRQSGTIDKTDWWYGCFKDSKLSRVCAIQVRVHGCGDRNMDGAWGYVTDEYNKNYNAAWNGYRNKLKSGLDAYWKEEVLDVADSWTSKISTRELEDIDKYIAVEDYLKRILSDSNVRRRRSVGENKNEELDILIKRLLGSVDKSEDVESILNQRAQKGKCGKLSNIGSYKVQIPQGTDLGASVNVYVKTSADYIELSEDVNGKTASVKMNCVGSNGDVTLTKEALSNEYVEENKRLKSAFRLDAATCIKLVSFDGATANIKILPDGDDEPKSATDCVDLDRDGSDFVLTKTKMS